jgi:hypothetical protein
MKAQQVTGVGLTGQTQPTAQQAGGVSLQQAGVVPMQTSYVPAQTNGGFDISTMMNLMIMMMVVVMMMKMMTQATARL